MILTPEELTKIELLSEQLQKFARYARVGDAQDYFEKALIESFDKLNLIMQALRSSKE